MDSEWLEISKKRAKAVLPCHELAPAITSRPLELWADPLLKEGRRWFYTMLQLAGPGSGPCASKWVVRLNRRDFKDSRKAWAVYSAHKAGLAKEAHKEAKERGIKAVLEDFRGVEVTLVEFAAKVTTFL